MTDNNWEVPLDDCDGATSHHGEIPDDALTYRRNVPMHSVNASLGKMILQILVCNRAIDRTAVYQCYTCNTVTISTQHTTTTHRLRAEAWRMHPL